ncbi:MAG: fused MFS/spermidine synthase, partial [bacterium]
PTLAAVAALAHPAFGYGTALGALVPAAARPGTAPGATSRMWACHHAGAAAGALVVTFLLVPALGLTLTFALTAAGTLGLAAAVSVNVGQRGQAVLAATGAALALGAGALGDIAFREAARGDHRLVFHHEDVSSVVEVLEHPATGDRMLRSDRLRQEGSTGGDQLLVQRVQGYLPILVHPRPSSVLSVGLGTGISLGPAMRAEVERLTVIEISPGIVQAARFFAGAQGGILTDPKTRLVVDDGRSWIRLTDERYDLIVQDLFFPYQAGVGALYAVEHYQRLRARLAPGGLAAQWIALNQIGPDGLRSVIKTFRSVMPETTLWLNGGYLLLLGGMTPVTVDLARFLPRVGAPDALGGLRGVVDDPRDLLGRFVTSAAALDGWLDGAPLNTESTAFVEYATPRLGRRLNSTALAVENLRSLLPLLQPVTTIVREATESERQRLDAVSQATALLLSGIVARAEGREADARRLYEGSHALNPANRQARSFLESEWARRGHQALLDGRLGEAQTPLERVLAVNTSHTAARADLAVVLVRRGEDASALGHFEQLVRE